LLGSRGDAPAPAERRRMTAATGRFMAFGPRGTPKGTRCRDIDHTPARGHGENWRPPRFDAAPKKQPIYLRAEAGRISKPLRHRVVLFFA
jgi:hypothetical protein